MKQLNVYFSFPGTCEAALDLYKKAFNGEIISLQRYGDSPVDTQEDYKQKIMHAEFRAGDIYFMACDSMSGHPLRPGDIVQLSINLTDAAEQETIFNSLAEGGTVNMPLQETFWGASFGMLTDKFGVHWMLNRELEKT